MERLIRPGLIPALASNKRNWCGASRLVLGELPLQNGDVPLLGEIARELHPYVVLPHLQKLPHQNTPGNQTQ